MSLLTFLRFFLYISCLVWNTKENSCNNNNAVIVANPSYEENPLLYIVKCIFGYPTNYDDDNVDNDNDEQIQQQQGEQLPHNTPPLQPLPLFVITHKTPGINEFLSAMVAVRQLECHLTLIQLIQIAVCIAATIPFKNGNNYNDDGSSGGTINNPTYMEFLYSNTVKVRKLLLSRATTTTTTPPLHNSGDDTNDYITNDQFWIETAQLATRLANAGK